MNPTAERTLGSSSASKESTPLPLRKDLITDCLPSVITVPVKKEDPYAPEEKSLPEKIKSSAAKIFQRRRNFTVPDGNVCFLELQVVCLKILLFFFL